MTSIRFLSSVLCDEIRKEASGSATLVGASPIGPSLRENTEQKVDRLGFYLEAIVRDLDSLEIRLRNPKSDDVAFHENIPMDYKKDIHKIDPEADLDGVDVNALVVMNHRQVVFRGAGEYLLEYSIEGGTWETIRAFDFPVDESNEEARSST